MKQISIVGAGLCGTLLAIRLAQRGYEVRLYEKRSDMRLNEVDAGRSINLALSDRGLKALRLVGLEDEIRKYCIPMKGRMIHSVEGELHYSSYSGRAEDYINSVSRGGLNIALLNKAEEYENLKIHFDHACRSVDIETATIKFFDKSANQELSLDSEIVIGTDGAGSAVRRSLMAHSNELLFNFSQNFLRHGYKELTIPAAADGGFRIEKNALHIWPRGNYMVIALPNLDGSFTVTMFHPFEGEAGFNHLNTKEKVLTFFKEKYPDILKHMPTFLEDYFENPTSSLGTVKCYPWQANGRVCIMGDASHAIVPFYGQGMNASFEDVFVFDQVLEDHGNDWNQIFRDFQDRRKQNTDAIADLAIDNFYEMRDHVDDPDFVKKRKLEMELEKSFPAYYSKYSLVSFKEDLDYHEAMIKGRKQDKWLLDLCSSAKDKEMSLAQIFEAIQKI